MREGGGQLPSSQCYELFETHWAQWAGYPKEVISDRGLHNRGSFAKSLSARGIQVINVGVEAPEQIGRVERHGGILKSMVLKVASDLGVSGIEEMKAVVAQCVRQKNSMARTQGLSPMQWVLGRSPREPGTVMDEESWSDLGSLQLATDESHEFGKMCKIREAARHAFVKADMGSRVSRAILRKAAPVSKECQCGDLVCYKTQQGGWSTASRVIGFDGPKIVWVIHRGVPVCVGLDKLRPVNASEALAHQYLHGQKPFQFGSRHQQQGYIDARLDIIRKLESRQGLLRGQMIRKRTKRWRKSSPIDRRKADGCVSELPKNRTSRRCHHREDEVAKEMFWKKIQLPTVQGDD